MNGGFAKYCCVRQEIVFILPENLDFETGALCEPFACSLQAVIELTTINRPMWWPFRAGADGADVRHAGEGTMAPESSC